MPKFSGTVWLCLDPTRPNQGLIQPIEMGPTLMIIFNASSGYHNLIIFFLCFVLYLTAFVCQIGRYRFNTVPFGLSLANDMFQRKIDEIFKGLPNIFGIADNVLIVGCDVDGRHHARSLRKVMQVCHWENVKLNKTKCYFRCNKTPFFWENISRGVLPDPSSCMC